MSWFSDVVDYVEERVGGSSPINPISVTRGAYSFLSGANPLGGSKSDISDVTQKRNAAAMSESERILAAIDKAKISPQIKSQLANMRGQGFDTVMEELRKAEAGEGVYASRKRNYNYLMLSKDRPAAMQLFSNARSRADASMGLLTGRTEGLLSRKV